PVTAARAAGPVVARSLVALDADRRAGLDAQRVVARVERDLIDAVARARAARADSVRAGLEHDDDRVGNGLIRGRQQAIDPLLDRDVRLDVAGRATCQNNGDQPVPHTPKCSNVRAGVTPRRYSRSL